MNEFEIGIGIGSTTTSLAAVKSITFSLGNGLTLGRQVEMEKGSRELKSG